MPRRGEPLNESLVEKLGWKQYIGKEVNSGTGDPVSAQDIRRFALALDDPNPRYYDEDFAKKTKYGGLVAPLTYVYWATHSAGLEKRAKDLLEDGLTPSAFYGIPEFPNIWSLGWVRGGDDYEFYQPVRLGDRVSVKCRVADIKEKEGKMGKLVFIYMEHVYRNQNGNLLARHVITMIGMPRKGKGQDE